MAIVRLVAETCAGGEVKDSLRMMAEIAERYRIEVEAEINGVRTIVGPDRVEELHQLWALRMKEKG